MEVQTHTQTSLHSLWVQAEPLLQSDPKLTAVVTHLPFHLPVQRMTSALFAKQGLALWIGSGTAPVFQAEKPAAAGLPSSAHPALC